jgi:hypothetical protein
MIPSQVIFAPGCGTHYSLTQIIFANDCSLKGLSRRSRVSTRWICQSIVQPMSSKILAAFVPPRITRATTLNRLFTYLLLVHILGNMLLVARLIAVAIWVCYQSKRYSIFKLTPCL